MGEASDQPLPASALPEWKYDVFVSFHGRDSRRRFMSHLFRAFEQADIRCYHDFDWDERGRIVESMLVDAIRGSRIALILFSPNYATSRWCLDEVVEILECNVAFRDQGHLVVPIFSDVEPTEVRKQIGVFGRGFDSCVAERGEAKAAAWRAALVEAGNRSGWHLKDDANGDESVLIEKIMGQVSSLTSFTNSRLFIKDVVGIDENARAVISLLDTGPCDEVRLIGLYGIEGIGKTTLARLVCSRIYFKFEGVSFLENIRDAKQEGIVPFQKTLLDDVSKVKRTALHDRDCNRNVGLIRDRLCRKKILLVLDSVEEMVQVSLLGGRGGGSLGPGSRILVTTRNEKLLDQLRVHCKFMVSGLSQEESYRLFSRHAFDRDDEEGGRKELSKNLVYYAGGYPPAIEALGTCLFGKTKDQWGKLLEQFARHPELDWIGAYSRNPDLFLLPYESKVEPCGGYGGNPYDDKAHTGIRQIEVVIVGGIVGSIRTEYDHNGSLIRSYKHGGSHEGQTFKVTLDYPDEFLTSISGCITMNSSLRILQSISFHSNRQRTYGPFGSENGNSFSFQERHIKGGKIIGFFGRSGSYLDSIGAYFGPVPHPYPFKTVGPFGHRDGDSWDDGKHADIRQIDVVFGSEVNLISVTYDNFGHPTIPFPHGANGGGKVQSVKLDYPYEYLTSISGYLRQHPGRLILQSVSLYSNTKKYGPFGQEIGIPFSGPATGGKIVGLYGSCNGHVTSIGAYLEPVSHQHPIRSIGPFGGDGGSPWDDKQKTGVRKIVVRCGTIINSIRVEYDDGGATVQAHGRGVDGGEQLHTVELDYPNEYIVTISGYLGQWSHMYLVNSLTFKSNRGVVYGPYGSEQGTFFSSPPNIGKIVGFYGRCGLYLDCIGAYFAPTFHLDPIGTVGPYGGEGGSPWDDGRHAGVQQIFISYGTVIDGICCVYDTTGKSLHRGGHGGCSCTIELDCPNEYLTSMSGYTWHNGLTVVRSLTFQSNIRTYGPFGSAGGTPFSFTSSARKIVGFYGRSGLYLDSIGAYLDPFPSS